MRQEVRRGRAAWAGVVASQRGDNLWHAPLQRGLRGAAHLSAGNMMWSSSRLFGYSDIRIFQHFPFPEPRARLISEPPHDTVCFLHAPRTAHRAQPPGRAQSGGGGWSARTVYCVIYCVTWDMQTLPRLSTRYPPIYQHYEWSHHRHRLQADTRGRDHEC